MCAAAGCRPARNRFRCTGSLGRAGCPADAAEWRSTALEHGDVPCDTEGGVMVMTADAHFNGSIEGSALVWIAANAVGSDALPTDLADEHDHYLYGQPKKGSGARN